MSLKTFLLQKIFFIFFSCPSLLDFPLFLPHSIRVHSLSTYAIFCKKLAILPLLYVIIGARTRTCAYQRVGTAT